MKFRVCRTHGKLDTFRIVLLYHGLQRGNGFVPVSGVQIPFSSAKIVRMRPLAARLDRLDFDLRVRRHPSAMKSLQTTVFQCHASSIFFLGRAEECHYEGEAKEKAEL
jgi:hypothetical protein